MRNEKNKTTYNDKIIKIKFFVLNEFKMPCYNCVSGILNQISLSEYKIMQIKCRLKYMIKYKISKITYMDPKYDLQIIIENTNIIYAIYITCQKN